MRHLLFTIPLTTLALTFSQPVLAHGDEGHSQTQQEHDIAANEHETENISADINAFEAWNVLQRNFDQAQSLYTEGNLESFHEITDAMANAVKILEKKYPDEERLTLALKQVAQVVDTLHVKADGGDAVGTASALKKLKGGLALVKVNLPEEAQGGEHSGNTEKCEAGMDCSMEGMTHDGHDDHRH